MRRIEAEVVLPPRAHPLASYGRHYAFVSPGRVRATYLLPLQPPGDGCVMLSLSVTMPTRPCPPHVIADQRRAWERAVGARAGPGQRRWYADPKNLPYIFDGGCTQVTLEYDVATDRIVSIDCNGYG